MGGGRTITKLMLSKLKLKLLLKFELSLAKTKRARARGNTQKEEKTAKDRGEIRTGGRKILICYGCCSIPEESIIDTYA